MCAKSVAVPKKSTASLVLCVCVCTHVGGGRNSRGEEEEVCVCHTCRREKRMANNRALLLLHNLLFPRFQAPNSSLAESSQEKSPPKLRALERTGQEWRTFGDSISFPTHNSFFLFDRSRFSHRTSGVEDGGRRSQRRKEEEGGKKRILLCSRIERERPLFPPPPFPDPIPPPPPSLLPQLLSARILRPDD